MYGARNLFITERVCCSQFAYNSVSRYAFSLVRIQFTGHFIRMIFFCFVVNYRL